MKNAWQEWKEKNKRNLEHPVGFEESFIDLVLSKIKEIDPDDVISQYHFIDNNGKNRYIDFFILNKEKNYALPIELDGYKKMQMGYEKFNDFLERQNNIISQFGILLRYSNKKMLNESNKIIDEIEYFLSLQQERKITQEIRKEQKRKLWEDYQNRIEGRLIDFENKIQESLKNLDESRKVIDEKSTEKSKKYIKAEIEQDRLNKEKEELIKMLKSLTVSLNSRQERENFSLQNKKTLAGLFIILFIFIALSTFYIFYNKANKNSENMVLKEIANHKSTIVEASTLNQPTNIKSINNKSKNAENKIINNREKTNQIDKTVFLEAEKANLHIGKTQTVCGIFAELKKFSGGYYINFNLKYPNQPFSVFIKNNNGYLLDNIDKKINEVICIYGKIEEYKGKPRMVLYESNQIISGNWIEEKMKKLTALFIFGFFLSNPSYSKETKIEAFKAPFYIGQSVMACGLLVEVAHKKKIHYLNLDKKFPKQTLSIIIFEKNFPDFRVKFGDFNNLIGSRFCALGTIEQYKDYLQIVVKNENFLRLMEK